MTIARRVEAIHRAGTSSDRAIRFEFSKQTQRRARSSGAVNGSTSDSARTSKQKKHGQKSQVLSRGDRRC